MAKYIGNTRKPGSLSFLVFQTGVRKEFSGVNEFGAVSCNVNMPSRKWSVTDGYFIDARQAGYVRSVCIRLHFSLTFRWRELRGRRMVARYWRMRRGTEMRVKRRTAIRRFAEFHKHFEVKKNNSIQELVSTNNRYPLKRDRSCGIFQVNNKP